MIEVLVVSLVLIAILDLWIIKQSHADRAWYAILWRVGTGFEAVIVIMGAIMLANNPFLDGTAGAPIALAVVISKLCYIVYKINRQKLYREITDLRHQVEI